MFVPRDETCPECSQIYYRTHVWKRICLDCWIAAKEATAGPGEPKRERAKPKQEHTSGFNSDDFWGKFHQSTAKPAAPAIDKEMLRRLIQLCHPDKHGGSEAANKATVYLLSLK